MNPISLTNVLRLVLVAALAGFALVTVAPGPTSAAGVPCQRTFTSVDRDLPIDDPGAVTSLIDVPEDGLVVADVDVVVDIHHTRPSDLTIQLLSFTDERVVRAANRLFHQDGGTFDDDLLGTVFDDGATTAISWANAPFTGRFQPSRPLDVHRGFTGGHYRLQVDDVIGLDRGTLNGWSLIITYQSCDLDADGVEDHADQCLDLAARAATGCPVTSRALTARFKAGTLRGALSSPVADCEAGRSVSLFRVRSGADAKVGTATTRADGSYRLGRAKKRGRYYAMSPRVAVPDRAECPAVRSAGFRIR
jgi:subtilisin-like proprotein convertase family protein